MLLAEDETDLLLFPPLRACWALRGQPKEVLLSGRDARRVVFGAMNPRTGHRSSWAREHQRSEDFQAFLHLIHHRYRGWHVATLLDGASSHIAGASRRLASRCDIGLIWLPKRAPQLNPMDHLWGDGKDQVSANRQHASIADQVARSLRYLPDLTPREALEKGGVLSRGFWLKSVLQRDAREAPSR